MNKEKPKKFCKECGVNLSRSEKKDPNGFCLSCRAEKQRPETYIG